ncbi:MAG: hypothetical protein Dasosvirus20_3 [Dasosvirus sp.]|uniref:Uncharacterized protein n=1 Tax=Dasosvirus sp. TaxID=2487764 RepID=A0A3G4ZVK5_9VIRU|nr:MAG: hypothetical protein Dasosvirus20_3 [Dasosvirus sp.]
MIKSYLVSLPTDIHVEIVKKLPKDYVASCEIRQIDDRWVKYIYIKDLFDVVIMWSRIDYKFICRKNCAEFNQDHSQECFKNECLYKFKIKTYNDNLYCIYHKYDAKYESSEIFSFKYIQNDTPHFNKWIIESISKDSFDIVDGDNETDGETSICVTDEQLKKILSSLNIKFDIVGSKIKIIKNIIEPKMKWYDSRCAVEIKKIHNRLEILGSDQHLLDENEKHIDTLDRVKQEHINKIRQEYRELMFKAYARDEKNEIQQEMEEELAKEEKIWLGVKERYENKTIEQMRIQLIIDRDEQIRDTTIHFEKLKNNFLRRFRENKLID